MKRILIFSIIFSFSFSINVYPTFSIGKSETMEKYGGLDLKLNISDYFFLNAGTSLIMGGAGAGFRYSHEVYNISPFVTGTVFSSYVVPLMCNNCDGLIHEFFSTGAVGVDMKLIKIKKVNINFQLGIMKYLYSEALSRSLPPNEPEGFLPFMNLKLFVK